jgi:hypothetical protein
MIADKTVFILGAGASKPYGFPTALELRKDIIYTFVDKYKKKIAEHNNIPIDKIPFPSGITELINQFKLSSTKSIDLFLSRNEKYYDLGKEIIAFLIAQYESKSKFREDVDNPAEDWYFEMFDLLTKEIYDPEKLVSLINLNKVSFITFNYDRSLEHFLYTSFFNSFSTKRNELRQIMPMFKFIHLYGKLAPLPWENLGPSYQYADEDYFEHLDEYMENIKIIFEDRKDGMEDAKNEILAAARIFFLGFGYSDENLAALEFSSLLTENHWIYGTAMGSTEVERRKIRSKLIGQNGSAQPDKVIIQDCDSVILLRNHIG